MTQQKQVEEKFLTAEVLLSRGFMLSTQEMFGGSYKAIIRNLVDKHGAELLEYFKKGLDLNNLTAAEKIQKLLENSVSADKIEVSVEDDGKTVMLRTYNCGHHVGRHIRGEIGLSEPGVCPVGILQICFIRQILNKRVAGGEKHPEYRDEKGYCEIRMELQ